ncbi:hypothetical protein ABIB40_001962 [Pedobacter sp. UYP30]|uniref:hypothetical protein n=1 Tax=Pedobacter sp. UYP30 TaxID=1756400 RepID=UPI003395CF75
MQSYHILEINNAQAPAPITTSTTDAIIIITPILTGSFLVDLTMMVTIPPTNKATIASPYKYNNPSISIHL